MEKFTRHTGVGVPLRRSNVDTDQIIPAVYLKRVTRTGFEDGLFAAWRNDPAFVLNQPEYAGATGARRRPRLRHRLVARARRVGAAGLRLQGRHLVRASPTSSAATPARPDCSPHRSTQDVVEQLWKLIETDPTTQIVVDLQERTIQADALTAPFEIDDYTRWRLLEGLDDVGITLSHEDDITAYESDRPSWKPVTR